MICLGIDTSNYTSSVAVTCDGEILSDKRKLLDVKQGSLGLRQSDALYQHWQNMPVLLKDALQYKPDRIIVSVKPRPKEGSYMPVFNAGKAIADILAAALDIPVFYLSHQEGHFLAAAYKKQVDFSKPIVCVHLSGGTLELVDNNFNIVGATKDISYGQIIDRLGVKLGLKFPCGKEIDTMACNCKTMDNPLSKVHTEGSFLNLSGLENQFQKSDLCDKQLAFCVMQRIAESFVKIVDNTNAKQILVSGGVASSQFLREYCKNKNYIFGEQNLCSDNAVGLALSEGNTIWHLNR